MPRVFWRARSQRQAAAATHRARHNCKVTKAGRDTKTGSDTHKKGAVAATKQLAATALAIG